MQPTSIRLLFFIVALCLPGCGSKSQATEAQTNEPVETSAKLVAEAEADDASDAKVGLSGQHRANPNWVPGEFKSGRGRWRDAGVYVDGQLVGMLWFGELPFGLEPVWVEEVEDLDFKPGDKGPRTKVTKVRRYRLAEYLEAIGVDLEKANEVHVLGGRQWTAMLDAKEVIRKRDTLYFYFGAGTYGKAVMSFPDDLKTNTTFDRLTGVAVYIDKKPPTRDENGVPILNGKIVTDMPYYGEPMRGGIRVYKDNRIATVIKRRLLGDNEKLATKDAEGNLHWDLFSFLEAQGVKTDDIAMAAIIYDERRKSRMTRAQLEGITFTANPRATGQILLGKEKIPVEGLALHTEMLPPPTNEPIVNEM